MDTKWRKNKAVIGLISWFAGITILAVNGLGFLLEASRYEDFGRQIKCVLEDDYQNMSEFRSYISDCLDTFLSMSVADINSENEKKWQEENTDTLPYDKDTDYYEEYLNEMGLRNAYEAEEDIWNYYDNEEMEETIINYYDEYYGYEYGYGWYMNRETAEKYHNGIKNDKNILYQIEKSGEILFTNEENFIYQDNSGQEKKYSYKANKNGKEVTFTIPEGYNFLLYFDGEKVRVWKGGEEINVYGDGYYRENSEWYVPGYKNFTVDEEFKDTVVYIAAAKVPAIYVKNYTNAYNNYSHGNNKLYYMQESIRFMKLTYKEWINMTIFAVVLLIIGFILRRERKEAGIMIAEFTGKIWYEIKLLPLLAVIVFFFFLLLNLINDFWWLGWEYIYEILDGYAYGVLKQGISYFILFLCIFIFWLFINDSRYNKKPWKKSLIGTIARICRTSSLKYPIGKRMVRHNIGICFFIWIVCIMCILFCMGYEEGIFTTGLDFILFLFLLAAVFCIPLFYVKNSKKTAEDIDNLVEQIRAIHDGELREGKEMDENSGLSEAMNNLNEIRNGMDKAVKEQTKSERMKVELVANVSHDIKTPLTSIISYIELLKQEDNLPEHVKEYVMILDSKSQRLKSMIQDVFEVSKAASGNLPVNIENLDLGKLLRQTIADMEEQIENSAVKVKTEISEDAVIIRADGERMYRVFQNIIQNALKYSLEGSRIYITLQESKEAAIAYVRNTSKEELDTHIDFTERFTRGDESRSDGGSGLGLSIARSFTEACGGQFKVETIADLFVVTVSFLKIRE